MTNIPILLLQRNNNNLQRLKISYAAKYLKSLLFLDYQNISEAIDRNIIFKPHNIRIAGCGACKVDSLTLVDDHLCSIDGYSWKACPLNCNQNWKLYTVIS